MKTTMYKAETRGHADHGWLNSWHTFSFAGYHDPARVHFGALRVLNDDTVAPGMGFGKHPHENMEIVSISLEGSLQHGDDMGTKQIIQKGDVQIMSAGTGVVHSEKNASTDEPVKFLQIWVFPNAKNVNPRYEQKTFSDEEKHNKLVTVVSPMGHTEGINIYQNAWFSLGNLDKGTNVKYEVKGEGAGVFVFLLEGDATVNDISMNRRDGLGIWEEKIVNIKADSNAEILLMEVPMN